MGLGESLKRAAAEKLVPAPFREFLPYVSPNALGVIHKERALTLALEIVANFISGKHRDEDLIDLEKYIKSDDLKVVSTLESGVALGTLNGTERIKAGSAILKLYFGMIRHPIPLFLDLRPQVFTWEKEHARVLWKPNRLRHRMSEEFQDRVRALYDGFFSDEANPGARGVALYRWESEPSSGFDERMSALLKEHFGNAREVDIKFDTSHFRNTFGLIFDEAIRSKSRFHPELTFLGTSLAGLYATLELLGEPLDVLQAYQSAMRDVS